MTELGTVARPLRVAIVGSGPAGFYAAEALFKSATTVQVDMFDRLPTPFGLVRGGVAPDHQKIKSVIKVYERIAAHERFAFWGNVTVGRDVSLDELRRFYDAVVFASGAESDRRLGIPGEDLPGSHTATEFVGWYNGHPDYRGRVFDLGAETAVVAGQGNVAMDVSRVLAKTPGELEDSDIAAHALGALTHGSVREVHVIGRRGPVQAKFTPPELKEIGELSACDVVVDPAELVLDPASQAELDDPENTHSRKNLALMREFSERPAPTKPKRYHLRFFLSPVELRGDGHVEEVVLERNRLTGEPGNLRAVGTGERLVQSCRLFFRSVGYRGVAIPGLPFDERSGVVPNRDGRIVQGEAVIPGLYVAGWIKRGPSGVIGTNKPCSHATVGSVLADLESLEPCRLPDSGGLAEALRARGARVVTFEDWKKIDAAEIARGQANSKPREKFTTVEEMLAVLG
jgi:ferredoxin--NADP+ reductase